MNSSFITSRPDCHLEQFGFDTALANMPEYLHQMSWVGHKEKYNLACPSEEDSDQPVHPHRSEPSHSI